MSVFKLLIGLQVIGMGRPSPREGGGRWPRVVRGEELS